jgi:hypothetical protein
VVSCDVAARGVVQAAAAEIAALRPLLGPIGGKPLPASFVKHLDEQTVVGLAAVYRATHDHGLNPDGFGDWGVLAAPRFFGRAAMAAALQRFAAEGAWGISPHLIPHRSLHSLSGSISQALLIRGPNFGVGGGPEGAGEGLLAALALTSRGEVPGVWIVLTGWDPELVPLANGSADPKPVCGAVALALVVPRPNWHGLQLRYHADGGGTHGLFTVEALRATLTAADGPGRRRWRLGCGGVVELEQVKAGAEIPS